MKECIFCQIVNGQIPAKKIYENTKTLTFLDLYPASEGHSLVITKKHYDSIEDTSEVDLAEIIKTVKKVAPLIREAVNADAYNLLQNNGKIAGQIINHIHFHIIPRKKGDGLKISPSSKEVKDKELEKTLEKIKNKVKLIT